MHLVLSFVLLLLSTTVLEVNAQTSAYCRPVDDAGKRMTFRLRSLAMASAGPEAEIRDTLQLPAVSAASDVVLLSDELVCQAAAAAYDTELVRIRGGTPQQRQVHVIRVGSVYVVVDPTAKLGEFHSAMLFSGTFELISFFTL